MKIINTMLIVMTLVVGAFIWEMFSDLHECNERCRVKKTVENYKLEIQLLEDIVKKEPKNHNAWKLLGNKYCATFDTVRAKQAWAKALETAPTGESADRIRAMIAQKERMYD